MKHNFAFGISITADSETGEILAVYFQIRKGKVHKTCEYADGAALADYALNGELLGIELIAPCKATIVDTIAANESASTRRDAKRFMRDSGPRKMVTA
ncbi:MAG: hypothetical protein CMJ48_12110 [Planctomycetaceae bacterium]|nr:hypothetical protein [Planctomycetaceae bacterium]